MGKKILKIGCIVGLVFFGVGLWSAAFAQEKKVLEDKAASVNGSIITKKQLERELTQIQQRLASQGKELTDSELVEIKKDLLESLINRELIYQESRRQKISAKESEVAEQYDGLKKRFPGEAEFNLALKQMNISEAEIKNKSGRNWN